MFNGIVYNTGNINSIKKNKTFFIVGIQSNLKFSNKEIGSSIACNGVCLTVTKIKNKIIYFYISNETLKRSNFEFLSIGDKINLEKSLTFGKNISGHFIQGHVDTTASVKKITIQGKTWLFQFSLKEKKLYKFLIEKASISINGISLTITKVKNKYFEVSVIPHTLKLTNLKDLKIRKIVNVELDIFVKYILKISK